VLSSVAADTPDDAWAVGSSSPEAVKPLRPLIEHWNGTRWTVAASPAVDAVLFGVSVSATDDAWAVGVDAISYETGESPHPFALAEHWNGKRWRRVRVEVPSRRPSTGILSGT
jgi:hypothetical protein